MFQIKAKVLYNNRVKDNYFHCAIAAPKIASCASPGQFANIKVSDSIEPLLRRPFSIHRVNGKKVEVLYEVVGTGTESLAKKKTGEYLDVIGPLGTGFTFSETTRQRDNETTILVGGGMGVAPLMFLAEKLAGVKKIVLIGAKTKSRILCEREFRDSGCDIKISTDDGSKGFRGKATDALKDLLSTVNCQLSTIYACGPRPMLQEFSRISKECNIPAQVSLEEHMACGIGACLGCVVNTIDGFKRVCKEGPVFEANQIIWGKE